MTDKQQIEKFATDLCKACRKSLKTCECKTPCVKAEWVSEALYNAGYRKVDENAVVLTRETWFETLDYQYGLGFRTSKQISRKETAKEILDKVDYESNGKTKQITDLLRKKYKVEE